MAKNPKGPIPTQLDEICRLADEFGQVAAALPPKSARRTSLRIATAVSTLQAALAALDPIRQPARVFDPSNPSTVGLFVSIALLAQRREPLSSLAPFYGSGVYAIYYRGPFAAYRPLAGTEHPIYVGKADPATPNAKTWKEQGDRLARRLRDHAKAIRRTENLDVADFDCRQLVVATGLQVAAETYLINLFKPIWNKEIKIAYGIGKHGDSPTTRANLRSPWDTLHKGRSWAHRDEGMRDQASRPQIVGKIRSHFDANPPFKSIDSVLHRFYDDLRQR